MNHFENNIYQFAPKYQFTPINQPKFNILIRNTYRPTYF